MITFNFWHCISTSSTLLSDIPNVQVMNDQTFQNFQDDREDDRFIIIENVKKNRLGPDSSVAIVKTKETKAELLVAIVRGLKQMQMEIRKGFK